MKLILYRSPLFISHMMVLSLVTLVIYTFGWQLAKDMPLCYLISKRLIWRLNV